MFKIMDILLVDNFDIELIRKRYPDALTTPIASKAFKHEGYLIEITNESEDNYCTFLVDIGIATSSKLFSGRMLNEPVFAYKMKSRIDVGMEPLSGSRLSNE